MMPGLPKFSQSAWVILLCWLILTGFNLFKAVHIDDTFHLEAAQWIQHHWSRPMSGYINWLDVPERMYQFNQPPLFFFLLAWCMHLFGDSVVMLHLVISLFVWLSLYFFNVLTGLLQVKRRLFFLSLFAFCPAFIINQNLMTDIPLLALVLGFVIHLLQAGKQKKGMHYVLAGLFLGAGLLIKYSVLPLLVVYMIVLLARRDFRYMWVVGIPVGLMALWSGWNMWEYGSVHFLDRPKGGIHINKLWAFLACTGSLSLFSIAYFRGVFPRPLAYVVGSMVLSFCLILIAGFWFHLFSEDLIADSLNIVFVINGVFVVGVLIYHFVVEISSVGYKDYLPSDRMLIALCIGATSVFMFLLAPFMATRHMLLILPFVLLYSHNMIEESGRAISMTVLTATVSLGILLGVSDWLYADYYRDMASLVDINGEERIWTAGHWGWQWYATQEGFTSYRKDQSEVQTGDYFIYPVDISRQTFGDDLQLQVLEKKWKEATVWTYFSGKQFASLYNSSVQSPPWTLSRMPIDTILICRVK